MNARPAIASFRFGLKSLLMLVAVVAIATHIYLLEKRVQDARNEYDRMREMYVAAVTTFDRVHDASLNCLAAELRSPLHGRTFAYEEHFRRCESLRRSLEGCHLGADTTELERSLEMVTNWRNQAFENLRKYAGDKRADEVAAHPYQLGPILDDFSPIPLH